MYVTNFCLSTDFNSAIMTASRKIGVLILIFSMSLLLTSVRANNCETELLHRCISRYRELVKEKPNNEQHCTRVQVRLTILRKISDQVSMNVMLKARQSFFFFYFPSIPRRFMSRSGESTIYRVISPLKTFLG